MTSECPEGPVVVEEEAWGPEFELSVRAAILSWASLYDYQEFHVYNLLQNFYICGLLSHQIMPDGDFSNLESSLSLLVPSSRK